MQGFLFFLYSRNRIPCWHILAHCCTTHTPRFWNILETSPRESTTTSGIPLSPDAYSCENCSNKHFLFSNLILHLARSKEHLEKRRKGLKYKRWSNMRHRSNKGDLIDAVFQTVNNLQI
jgi:hypothetical protein